MKEMIYILKKLANKRREVSFINIRKFDPDYEELMDRIVELNAQKEELDLPPKAYETIKNLLDALEDEEIEQVNLSYLAGIADCLLILERLELFGF